MLPSQQSYSGVTQPTAHTQTRYPPLGQSFYKIIVTRDTDVRDGVRTWLTHWQSVCKRPSARSVLLCMLHKHLLPTPQTHRPNRPTWIKPNVEYDKAGGPSLSAGVHQHQSTLTSQFLPAQHSPYLQPVHKPRAPSRRSYLAREPSQALPVEQMPAGRATTSRSLQMQAQQIRRANARA